MLRNVAGQKISVFAFDYTTGAPKTGDGANITVYVSKDDGTVTALTDTSATEKDSTNAKGWYDFDLSQSETNAVKLLFTGKSATANVSVVGQCIYTTPATTFDAATTIAKLDTMLAVAAGSPSDYAFSNDALRNVPLLSLNEIAGAVWNTNISAIGDTDLAGGALRDGFQLTFLTWQTQETTIQPAVVRADAVTAKLDTTLQVAAGSPTDYAFSNDALRNVPLLVLNEIADAVWNRAVAGRTSAGTFGLALALAQEFAARLATTLESAGGSPNEFRFSKDALRQVPGLVWDAERSLYTVSGSFGAAFDATISSRASSASLSSLDLKVTVVKSTTDKFETLLIPAGSGSPADYAFHSDAFRYFPSIPYTGPSAATIAGSVWDVSLASHLTAGSAGLFLTGAYTYAGRLSTTLEPAGGSPGDYQFTADSLRNAPAGSGGGGGGPSAGAVADAVWDELVSGHLSSGTFGLFAYNVSLLSAKLDTLLEGSGSPGDYRLTNEALAKAADVVLNAQLSNHTSGGSAGDAIRQTDLRGRRTAIYGTVGNVTTPSLTQFTPSSLEATGASADQLKGRIIVFDKNTATTALQGCATDITNSSSAALPLLTFSTLSAVPSAGDTFTIV